MPLYDLKCKKCGREEEEVFLKINDELPRCKSCGGDMIKILSPTTFVLKGNNWAKDNYGLKKVKKSKGGD